MANNICTAAITYDNEPTGNYAPHPQLTAHFASLEEIIFSYYPTEPLDRRPVRRTPSVANQLSENVQTPPTTHNARVRALSESLGTITIRFNPLLATNIIDQHLLSAISPGQTFTPPEINSFVLPVVFSLQSWGDGVNGTRNPLYRIRCSDHSDLCDFIRDTCVTPARLCGIHLSPPSSTAFVPGTRIHPWDMVGTGAIGALIAACLSRGAEVKGSSEVTPGAALNFVSMAEAHPGGMDLTWQNGHLEKAGLQRSILNLIEQVC